VFNAAGSTDVILDVVGYTIVRLRGTATSPFGWFTDSGSAASGSQFVGMTPTRILDTAMARRIQDALGPHGSIPLPLGGVAGIPADASAVVANVTVTGTTAGSYLTAWPDGSPQPLASDLNWTAGITVPNLVVVKLGPNGKLDLYNAVGSTDVILDVVGYYH